MKSLALIQVDAYGAALEAANLAMNRESLELLEIIPFGSYCQVLLQGPSKDLYAFRRVLRTADLQKSVIIENPDPRLLKAYYHLENQAPENYLLILENEFAGYLFQWAQTLLKKNLQIVEFRQPRFPGAMAILVLTGSDLGLVQEEMGQMEANKIRVSFVEEPTAKLKAYFDIEAKP